MTTRTMTSLPETINQWIERAQHELSRFPLSITQFLARLSVAVVFWRSGLTKTANFDLTVALFRDEYKVPLLPADVAAFLATTFELGCAVLLVIGLATRLATLPLLGITFVIQFFVYPNSWPDHLMWTALLIFVLTQGPGVLSLDHLFGRILLPARRS